MRKILFVSSEVHPLIKTGGLGDVSASLPIALKQHQQDIRILMPAYRQSLSLLQELQEVASLKLEGYHRPVRILQSTLPQSNVTLWLLDSPHHYDRDGDPYSHPDGHDWEDNAARFALLSRAAVALAMNKAGLNWQADILHCNDWQTGLAPALIADVPNRPITVFTIHNLAYQGLFSREVFDALDIADSFWHPAGLEFYGQLSFIKGGLVYADHITTVSPTYAEEICSDEFGYGLQGLLSVRAEQGRLSGILNGIDDQQWNPETDHFLVWPFSKEQIAYKGVSKRALQQRFMLPESDCLLVGSVSRLVAQKGIDLTIKVMTTLLRSGANIQFVCLGGGEAEFEQDLRILCDSFPTNVGLRLGYDERLAHQIEAGVDAFVMPSRFEPCGLNQLYSLRYGTLPIVRDTGGLADTVIDATDENRKQRLATGFKFQQPTAEAMMVAVKQAIDLFQHRQQWQQMVLTAMEQDYSWENSANAYLNLYSQIISEYSL